MASIVISRLKEIDPAFADEVDDSVLLGESPRPDTLPQVSQGLRFADSLEGITQYFFYKP